MSSDARTTCEHGIEIQQFDVRGQLYSGTICPDCANDMDRKERRAKWIRENVATASMYAGQLGYWGVSAGADLAEQMADELIKRGYL